MSERSSASKVKKLGSNSSESDLKSVSMASLQDDFASGSGNQNLSEFSDEVDDAVIEQGVNEIMGEPEVINKQVPMTPIAEESEADLQHSATIKSNKQFNGFKFD